MTEPTLDISSESLSEPKVDENVHNVAEEAVVNESKSENEEMDDLFGDDEEEDMTLKSSNRAANESQDDEEEDEINYGRSRSHVEMDEEEAMYTRKFYGDDVENYSADDDGDHSFKEEDVQLVRHMVPYTTLSKSDDEKSEEDLNIYYTKVPQFLMIDPIPFDPPSFVEAVEKRLTQEVSEEDQIGDRLVDENTIRWRYSRDENHRVFKESNAQVVKWSDGSYSLKVGEEYTDILVNDTDNTFLTVSHDQQELMQCTDGGKINKTMMFIPTSTNSKIHQRLSKAVARRNKIEHNGPGTYLVQVDPEIEKRILETKQNQIMRERRKRQIKENELLDAGEGAAVDSFGRRATQKPVSSASNRGGYQDEYEEDDFLVDDDEDENEYQEDDDEDEDDIDNIDATESEKEEQRNAERLKNMKRNEATFKEDDENNDDTETPKKRRTTVISDDEDDE